MKRILLLLLCLQPALAQAAPRVVTSIAPLQEIAGALMAGIAEPQLIIENEASAHHFAFKPSHLRRLQQADLVIWIDRHFESGFNRIAQTLPAATRTLELMPALDIDSEDGHFWYSPALLRQSVSILATTLAELDPDNRARYLENARRLSAAVAAWRERMQTRWQGSAPRLLTDHEFLGHFARDLGGFEIESVQDHHGAQGGLKELARIEAWLRARPAACLLTLDPAPPPLAASLAARYRIPVIVITAIEGTNPELDAFLQRLERLQLALEDCLAKR
jgi:zinc transport system substrate-binding protein